MTKPRALLFRPEGQADEMIRKFEAEGFEAVHIPLICIEPLPIPACEDDYFAPFTKVIFTSANGAEHFHPPILCTKEVIAVGKQTAAILEKYGIHAWVPAQASAEGILEALPKDMSKEKILLPSALEGRAELPEGLRARGASVEVLPVYRTVLIPKHDLDLRENDHLVFTSPSTVDAFYLSSPSRNDNPAYCIGCTTYQHLLRYRSSDAKISLFRLARSGPTGCLRPG